MPPSPFDPRAGFFEHAALAALRLAGCQSHNVVTSGGRIHVLSVQGEGAGAPVVLLHGFSSTCVHYGVLMQRLRRHVRRVIAPDAPAHGFSDQPEKVDPAALQAGLLEALDKVVDEPSIVYGNSMGGLAAARFALLRPSRVKGLVLCSPLGAPMKQDEIDRLLRRFALDDHDRALRFVDRVLKTEGAFRHLLAWGVRRKFGHPVMRELLSAFGEGDLLLPEEIRRLAVPLLFVWGREEEVLPPEHRDFFLEHLPAGAQVHEPPRFGHGPYLEHPEAVARQILEFERSLRVPKYLD
ncbi:MAG TPA: alpha/beta fold hydrolase [Myxococcales bacterium]|jgi:pimeloyl-ACP methyl ester carboxylesterase